MFNPFIKSENLPPTSLSGITGDYHLSSKNSMSSISPSSSSKLSANSSLSTSPCYLQRQIENQSSSASSVSTSSNSIDSVNNNQYSNFNHYSRYSSNSEAMVGYENIQAKNYNNFQVNQTGLTQGNFNLERYF